MSNPVPSSLALTTPADGTTLVASRDRNNDNAIQTAVNALIAALSGGTSGQVLQAASSSAVQWAGGYTSFTPVWTATGVAPSLGNASVLTQYVAFGKLVHFWGRIVFGSTTTFGTGAWSFTLPANIVGGMLRFGVITGDQAATANMAQGQVTVNTASTFTAVYPSTYNGPASSFASAAPWAWTTNDQINWNMVYEAA